MGNCFCWKCTLRRTGDFETFFYFKCVNTPSSPVSVLLGTSTGKGKAGNIYATGKQSWIIFAMWDQRAYVQNHGFCVGFEGNLPKLLSLFL